MIDEMLHYSDSVKIHESNLFTILDDIDRLKAGMPVEATPGSDPEYKKLIKRRDEENATIESIKNHVNGVLQKEFQELKQEAIQFQKNAERYTKGFGTLFKIIRLTICMGVRIIYL